MADSIKIMIKDRFPERENPIIKDLYIYEEEIKLWQKAIQLVSHKDLDKLWTRHIRESLFFYDIVKEENGILDLGSGGGFPAIVLAILAKYENNNPQKKPIGLVESNKKKASFLKAISAKLNLNVKIYNQRIETLEADFESEVVTARALASLRILCDFTFPFFENNSIKKAYFAKGESFIKEIKEAEEAYKFSYEIHKQEIEQSLNEMMPYIIEITDLQKRNIYIS